MDTRDRLAALKRTDIVGVIEASSLGFNRRYDRGEVLFWQNDPVDYLYLIRSGIVKTNTLTEDGRRRTYGLWGRGALLGLTAYSMVERHVATARVLQSAEVLLLTPADLDRLVKRDSSFTLHLMLQLAYAVKLFMHEVDALSFLGVQERLKRNLEELAIQHGHSTPDGIEIDLAVTHEDIAELIGANRTTITAHLNDLKKQGYLWKSGRHLVIVPQEQIRLLENLAEAVSMADGEDALRWARRAIQEEIDLVKVLEVLTRTLRVLEPDEQDQRGEHKSYRAVAKVVKDVLAILSREVSNRQCGQPPTGKVVLGTLLGDPHDVGRRTVNVLLLQAGYEVIDLGVEANWRNLIRAATEHRPSFVVVSSSIALDRDEEDTARDLLEASGLLDQATLVVGGAGFSSEIADRLGAAAYASSVDDTVLLIKSLCNLT